MKKLLLPLLFFLSLGFSATSQAELQAMQDADLRSVVGQQRFSQETHDNADRAGVFICDVLCPTLTNLSIGVPISLQGGVTGALFGINGDSGSGFIGNALDNIAETFK
ncbi:MAG TPA: hypothetical protein DCZ03_11355 [Gammaproteobacteria bacterium]|nr:hypothetical protein [Gammaproteobacteria bacterium]